MDNLRNLARAVVVGTSQFLHARRVHSPATGNRDRRSADPNHSGSPANLGTLVKKGFEGVS